MKNTNAWKRLSSPLGTQPGGVFESLSGQQYYVKRSLSDEHARNEVLASLLYTMAGVSVVQVELIEHNGRLGTASPMIDGASTDLLRAVSRPVDSVYLSKIKRGFAVDVWLTTLCQTRMTTPCAWTLADACCIVLWVHPRAQRLATRR
jgi:hypothetical protein